jgi:hypothetical protein
MGWRATWLLVCLCSTGAQAQEPGWTVVGREGGVTISRRAGPEDEPAFRGRGSIRGKVEDVLALLSDAHSINQWAYGISRVELVKQLGPNVDVIYLFSHTPWPIRDRDMVVRREIKELRPGDEYRITLRCQAGIRPANWGIVRVNKCESGFRLRRVDDQTTEITYWASVDDAGHLPHWTIAWVARQVPSRTIAAIQEQVARREERGPAR